MCTKEETINTGINIDTVKESKRKLQEISNASESTHLNNSIDTGTLFIPTSKNAIKEKIVVKITQPLVINCEPVTPTFLPKNPEIIEPNRGNIIMFKYII